MPVMTLVGSLGPPPVLASRPSKYGLDTLPEELLYNIINDDYLDFNTLFSLRLTCNLFNSAVQNGCPKYRRLLQVHLKLPFHYRNANLVPPTCARIWDRLHYLRCAGCDGGLKEAELNLNRKNCQTSCFETTFVFYLGTAELVCWACLERLYNDVAYDLPTGHRCILDALVIRVIFRRGIPTFDRNPQPVKLYYNSILRELKDKNPD